VNAERDHLTPQQRLTISRQALIAQMQGEQSPLDEIDATAGPRPHRSGNASARPFSWSAVSGNVVRRWWRRHPANAAGQLALPLLERYAREEPAKLIAAAAATGALVVLVKPWRLLSITAVLAAVLKTSDVADLVTTLMKKTTNPRKDAP
jgi:hypothetical protein